MATIEYSPTNRITLNQYAGKSGTMSHQHHHQGSNSQNHLIQPPSSYSNPSYHSQHHFRNYKRKTAVELLAESKPYFMKPNMMKAEPMTRSGSNAIAYALSSPSRALASQSHQQFYPQSSTLGHPGRPANRRSASSGSDLLQTKLRRLIQNTESSFISSSSDDLLMPKSHKYQDYYHPKNFQQQLTVHNAEQQSDVNVFFPSAFLSPQSLPPQPNDDLYSYSIDDENLILTDNYRPISPPAEYAQKSSPTKHEKIKKEKPGSNRFDYQRSYSHHQTEGDYGQRPNDPRTSTNNINSHKSLPDLHTQISRHSPHSEALSCCSRSRSNRSAGSSFNRDSGGSSGHYTHKSEPCCKQLEKLPPPVNQEYRRDSGSSTQHSGNSYYAYAGQQFRYDCIECRAKMRDVEHFFPTPEVPEAFQDHYDECRETTNSSTLRNTYYNQQSSVIRSPSPPSSQLMSPGSQLDLSPPLGQFVRQKALRFKSSRVRYAEPPGGSNSQPTSLMVEDDERRQERVIRSKSDIGDRYWTRLQQNQKQQQFQHADQETRDKRAWNGSSGSGNSSMSKSESMCELEQFFDRLGLNDANYAANIEAQGEKRRSIVKPKSKSKQSYEEDSDGSSAVFFSDASTVDSTRIVAEQIIAQEAPVSTGALTAITVLNNQANNMYRPSEPTSIVERNARIIKWLCNCKKMQLL